MAHFIQRLGERGVNIQAFYCIEATPEGRHIARNLGFTEIYTSLDGDRSAYKLLTNDEESKLARFYMKGLAASQQQTENEPQLALEQQKCRS